MSITSEEVTETYNPFNLISMDDLSRALSTPKRCIKELVSKNDFPKPILITKQKVMFFIADINDWLRANQERN